MATPTGLWLRLHVGLPRNRKVRPLSDAAFRLLIELMCWAKEEQTDGLIEADVQATFARPPKVWTELKRRRLLDDAGRGDLAIHDWLDWQESVDDETRKRDLARRDKSLGGSKGNHERWHVQRGIVSDDCAFCHPDPIAYRSHTDRICDPKEAEIDRIPIASSDRKPSQNDRQRTESRYKTDPVRMPTASDGPITPTAQTAPQEENSSWSLDHRPRARMDEDGRVA